MKKVLMMLCAILAFTSCSKEAKELEGRVERVEQTLTLEVSAIPDDITSVDKNEARAGTLVNFYIDGTGKLRAFLEKNKVPVFTYIYNGSSLVYEGILNWSVKPDKRTLYYEGAVGLKRAIDPTKETKLVALLGYGDNSTVFGAGNVQIPASQVSVGPIKPDDTGADNILKAVPFVLVNKLDKVGDFLTNKPRDVAEKRFKPKGTIVRVVLENTTAQKIPVGALAVNELSVGGVSYWRFNSSIGELEYVYPRPGSKSYDASVYPIRNAQGRNSKIDLEPFQNDVELLYWYPKIDPRITFDLIYWVYPQSYPGTDTRRQSSGYYTPYTQVKAADQHMEGKVYTLRLKVRQQENPLSFFSEYPVAAGGASFATTHAPNDPSYGLFTFDEAKGLSIGAYNRLPTQAEWNLILPSFLNPTVLNKYIRNDMAAIGSYSMQDAESTFAWASTPPATYSQNNQFVIYAIRFDKRRGWGISDLNTCFVFRYHWQGGYQGRYSLRIQCKPITRELLSNNSNWQEIALNYLKAKPSSYWDDAVERIFPSVNMSGDATVKEGAVFWGSSNGMGYYDQSNQLVEVPAGVASYAWVTPRSLKLSTEGISSPSVVTKYPVYLYKGIY